MAEIAVFCRKRRSTALIHFDKLQTRAAYGTRDPRRIAAGTPHTETTAVRRSSIDTMQHQIYLIRRKDLARPAPFVLGRAVAAAEHRSRLVSECPPHRACHDPSRGWPRRGNDPPAPTHGLDRLQDDIGDARSAGAIDGGIEIAKDLLPCPLDLRRKRRQPLLESLLHQVYQVSLRRCAPADCG